MARGGKKDEDAIALAGAVAAKAVYDTLEQQKEGQKDKDAKEAPRPAAPIRETSVLVRDRASARPDDDLLDDDDADHPAQDHAPPAAPVAPAFGRGGPPRRPGVGGFGGFRPLAGRQGPPPGLRGRPAYGFDRSWEPQPEGEADHANNPDVQKVLDSIPKTERASVLFKFRQRRMVSGGKVMFRPITEWNAVGDPAEWQARVKEELASRGPGFYEGIPHTPDGKPIPDGTNWVFEIKDEEARAAGWQPEEEKEKQTTVSTMPVVTAPPQTGPAVSIPEASEEDDMEKLAKREKARIDYLKNKLECTKIENQLANEQEGGSSKKPATQEIPAIPKDAYSKEAAEKVIEAEKARLAAEHKAELAKLEADRKAEIAKLETDREKAEIRLKNEAADERRKAEDALKDLKTQMDRKESEHANKLVELQRGLERQFEDKFKGLEKTIKDAEAAEAKREKDRDRDRDRPPERKPEETAVAVAGALANAFGPILTPVLNAWAAKMNQPPPPPPPAPVVPAPPPAPDPVKQVEAIAKIFQPILDRAANPPAPPPPPPAPPAAPAVDPMAIVTQTIGLVKDVMPKPERGVKADEIADAVAKAVEARLPAPQPPAPPQDPFQFTNQVMSMAKGFADMTVAARGGSGGGDEDRGDPTDPIEVAENTINRLKRLGVPITIGTGPVEKTPPEPPKPNLVGEIFAGVKETLPAFGDAVAKYMNSRQPQVDPKLLNAFQADQLRKKTEMRRKAAPGQRRAAPPQQRQQHQQPAPVQHAPPQPVQHAPVQHAPVQQHAPQRPYAPQPGPQPQQPAAPVNRFVPPQQAAGSVPYNLPTEVIMRKPPATSAHRVPVDTIPQRAPIAPQASPKPVEHLPTAPAGGAASRVPAQQLPQRPQAPQTPQAPQRPAPQPRQQAPRQPLTPQPRPAAATGQGQSVMLTPPRRPQAPQQPAVIQQPAPAPTPQQVVQQLPQPPAPQQPAVPQQPAAQQDAVVAEELDANGIPTMKVWGELANYAVAAIDRNEDTDVAALHLIETFPTAANLVRNVVDSMGVDGLDTLLTKYAHEAGPYAEAIGGLASRIRNQGKDWATRLVASLKGSSVGA